MRLQRPKSKSGLWPRGVCSLLAWVSAAVKWGGDAGVLIWQNDVKGSLHVLACHPRVLWASPASWEGLYKRQEGAGVSGTRCMMGTRGCRDAGKGLRAKDSRWPLQAGPGQEAGTGPLAPHISPGRLP